MHTIHLPARIALVLAAFALSTAASAQQRVDFERKKFDRSRFDRPGQAAPAAPAEFSAPAAMPAEPPASSSSVFSYSNTAASGFSSPAPSTNTAIFSADAPPLSGPPPVAYPPGATPEEKAAIDKPLFDLVPNKWFNNAKDYEELLQLQKKTGACMLVYFQNPSVPNEKGLCSWFEKSITTDIDWRKAMKYYIKLEITFPGPSAVRDLAAQFKAVKTPALFVVKPGSTLYGRIMVFDYPAAGRPTPIEVPRVLEALKSRSTPAYATLF